MSTSLQRGRFLFKAGCCLFVALVGSVPALAQVRHGGPAHPNTPGTILWEQDGVEDGNTNHNHLLDHDIRNRNDEATHHSHDTFAAWHNRTYAIDAGRFAPPFTSTNNNFFHGFIEENVAQPRYRFAETGFVAGATGMNTAAQQNIINDSFNLWESQAHSRGPALPGRRTGADWDNNQTEFEFSIFFIDQLAECRNAAAEWLVVGSQLNANTVGPGCAVGAPWSNLAAVNLPSLVFDDDLLWDFLEFAGGGAPAAGHVDFATIALHETGHVVGLGHTPGDYVNHIMRASIYSQATDGVGLRAIENDSGVGAAELYTVTPEPGTFALLSASLIGWLTRQRRRR